MKPSDIVLMPHALNISDMMLLLSDPVAMLKFAERCVVVKNVTFPDLGRAAIKDKP